MKKSSGYILLQDIFIFMICSVLIISAMTAWKNSIMKRQQYQKLSQSIHMLEDYQAGRSVSSEDKVKAIMIGTEIGTLMELQAWEKNDREQMVCNFFRFKKED